MRKINFGVMGGVSKTKSARWFVWVCVTVRDMCVIGCAGSPTPSKIPMYHTLVVAPAFLAIVTIGPSTTVVQ
jgi:FtsH-binding integral membrane protein